MAGKSFVCSVLGAIPGQTTVSGDVYLQENFQYSYSHIWRNLGILIAFWMFFLATYLLAAEFNLSASTTMEALVFRRGHVPKVISQNGHFEMEPAEPLSNMDIKDEQDMQITIAPEIRIFAWCKITYDIDIRGRSRRLLDDVSGWATPGTLTALMGVSGAGKTTLLDALAKRLSVGVVGGDLSMNGKPVGISFQRQIGKTP
jgi:ATP-binding cassette, subfamily G (WHITE), member 2, PDR